MKICIIAIDHGKPELTEKLHSSIKNQSPHDIEIQFIVLENSGKVAKDDYRFIKLPIDGAVVSDVQFLNNDGYFGTASQFLKTFEFRHFDWLIVCNNDLSLERNFFKTLSNRQNDIADKYLICPSVIEQGRDINPLSRKKYPQIKKTFWDFYYKHRMFALCYEVLRLPISKLKFYARSNITNDSSTEGEVYLGYGAIYLLNPEFIIRLGGLPAETFLYQEESVICSYARNFSNWPYLLPALKVHHDAHATLRYISFDKDYELRREAWWRTRKFLS